MLKSVDSVREKNLQTIRTSRANPFILNLFVVACYGAPTPLNQAASIFRELWRRGGILLSELSRRRIHSIQKLIRVGRNEVVMVLRVNQEKGYIDLSKRHVSPMDVAACEDKSCYCDNK